MLRRPQRTVWGGPGVRQHPLRAGHRGLWYRLRRHGQDRHRRDTGSFSSAPIPFFNKATPPADSFRRGRGSSCVVQTPRWVERDLCIGSSFLYLSSCRVSSSASLSGSSAQTVRLRYIQHAQSNSKSKPSSSFNKTRQALFGQRLRRA